MASPKQPETQASRSPAGDAAGNVELRVFLEDVVRQFEAGFARHSYESNVLEGTVSDGRKLALAQVLKVLLDQGLTVSEVREALERAGVRMEAVRPLDLPGPWTEEKNARRVELIDKKIQGTLSSEELREFESLQAQAIAHRDRVAPLPIEGARRLHQELLERAQNQQRPAD